MDSPIDLANLDANNYMKMKLGKEEAEKNNKEELDLDLKL